MSDQAIARAVGQRIATARHAARLTQGELAARLGWPRDTLIHYEHGRRALSVDRLAEIAAALNVHPAVLLIADETLGGLVARLAVDERLRAQVSFFLSTLDEDV